MCFGCSKEPSHQEGSFENPQHMFWLRNKKDKGTLIWGQDKIVYLILLTLYLLVLSADNFCKKFGPRSADDNKKAGKITQEAKS